MTLKEKYSDDTIQKTEMIASAVEGSEKMKIQLNTTVDSIDNLNKFLSQVVAGRKKGDVVEWKIDCLSSSQTPLYPCEDYQIYPYKDYHATHASSPRTKEILLDTVLPCVVTAISVIIFSMLIHA